MTDLGELPLWAELLTAALLLGGAILSCTGALGLVRLGTFYDRVHAPTLCTSLGMTGFVAASMLYFSVAGSRPVIHEVLIIVLVTLTTPVTLVLLARAAHLRELEEHPDNSHPAGKKDRP